MCVISERLFVAFVFMRYLYSGNKETNRSCGTVKLHSCINVADLVCYGTVLVLRD